MGIPQPQRSSGWSGGGGSGGGFNFGQMRQWSLTYWLIAINIAVFVADMASGGRLTDWGAFTISDGVFRGQVWRFVTCMFLHAGLFHIFFNMLALYYFGGFVEARFGRKRYLAYYLICGICGVLSYMALYRLRFLDTTADTGMVGASAAIYGVLIGVVYLAPGVVVRLLLPPVAMRIRTMALLFIGLAVVIILTRGPNAGGEAAHLGGALGGWLLITNPRWLNIFDRQTRKPSRFWRPGDPGSKFFREERR
jgi:membrane associated rhomboid family serine protease